MKSIKEIIKLHQKNGFVRQISRSLSLPRSTITDYVQKYKTSGFMHKDIADLDDESIYQRLLPQKRKIIQK